MNHHKETNTERLDLIGLGLIIWMENFNLIKFGSVFGAQHKVIILCILSHASE